MFFTKYFIAYFYCKMCYCVCYITCYSTLLPKYYIVGKSLSQFSHSLNDNKVLGAKMIFANL